MIAAVRGGVALLVLAVAYVLLVSSVDRWELLVGVLLAGVASAAGGLARTGGDRVRLRHVPLGVLATVPSAVLTGTAQVLRAAATGRPGRLREALARASGDDERAVTLRAFGALSVSAGPATTWVEADPATGTVLLHELGTVEPGRTEQALQRTRVSQR